MKLAPPAGKSAELDGSRLPSAESLRREFPTLVFTPDRLAVVKGGPAVRRAYLDRVLARLLPGRSAGFRRSTPQRSRSATPRSAARSSGSASRDAVAPWTERLAELGGRLVEARRETTAALEPGFRLRLEGFGLPGGTLVYEGEPPSREALEARLETDLARGTTGLGPHLDDLLDRGRPRAARLRVAGRAAARGAVAPARGGVAPLTRHRCSCSTTCSRSSTRAAAASWRRRCAGLGQTVITATHASALPASRQPGRGGEPWNGCLTRFAASSSRFGAAGGPRRGGRALAGRGRRGDRAQCVARPDRPRRHAARQHRRLGLGLRACPAAPARSRSDVEVPARALCPGPAAGVRAAHGPSGRSGTRPRTRRATRPPSQPRSPTKTYAKLSKKRRRSRSPAGGRTAPRDILVSARKTRGLQAFLVGPASSRP